MDTHRWAQRAVMFYSFFGTNKKNDVNLKWIRDVLERIPTHKPKSCMNFYPRIGKNLKWEQKTNSPQ
jgi:hypothetical protein